MRALLLALALLLAACPAWAGIVPSFGGAQITVFQQHVLPDTNFAGHSMVQITHRTAGVVGDSLNYGLLESPAIGKGTSRTHRIVESWTFGSYLPASAIIDSLKEVYSLSGSAADSLFASLLLVPWVPGTGDGTFSGAEDTTGVCWRSPNYPTVSAWNKRPADSCFTALGTVTFHTAREQSLLGKLNYGGAQDREGSLHYIGKFSASSEADTMDVSFARFIYNDVRAGVNYGWVVRVGTEATGAAAIKGPMYTTDATQRPKLIVYWHDQRQAIVIGGGN